MLLRACIAVGCGITFCPNGVKLRSLRFNPDQWNWLRQLRLSPKSKSHVRNLLRVLVEYAMWSGLLEISRNPIDLVVVKGATTRSLTVEQSRGSTYNSGSLSKQWLSYVCVWGLGLANCLL